MVYYATRFSVMVEPIGAGEYETADLERTFVTDGAMPAVYEIAVDYFSQINGTFRIVSIQDMGSVLVAGPRPVE